MRRILKRNTVPTVILAGVVPNRVAGLARSLKSPQSQIANRKSQMRLRFRKELPCLLTIRPRPAAKVGDDRLAAALGALAIDPRVPWVVVDAGTALTVNGVKPAARRGKARSGRRVLGTFEGGLIVPGEWLSLLALSGGTAQLPALKPLAPRKSVPAWGRSTEQAIRFGVRRAQLATVCELARAQAEALGKRARIALTGGGAEALWPALRRALATYRPIRDPDLVHRGLLAALDVQ